MPSKPKKPTRPTRRRTLARTVKGGKGGGRIVSKQYAKANPDSTVVEAVQRAAWRGWGVQLKNGKLLANGPTDGKPMLFPEDKRSDAEVWPNAEDGERVVPVRVLVGR